MQNAMVILVLVNNITWKWIQQRTMQIEQACGETSSCKQIIFQRMLYQRTKSWECFDVCYVNEVWNGT